MHLNELQGNEIKNAFYLAGEMAASLLNHKFTNRRMQQSREEDPIVGVSFTGLFDYFVRALGEEWLRWMIQGRPNSHPWASFHIRAEESILRRFKDSAIAGVTAYCQKNELKVPNRVTTVQPAGSKSLLTNSSPGWHPPKANYYIRRITFAKNDPVALAYRDLGYNIIPSESDKDESGQLLDNPFDERCTEWMVEIPNKTVWADSVPEELSVRNLPIAAQWGLYMQVQRHYTQHSTSATLEISEEEIPKLAHYIHAEIQSDGDYISAAVLSKMDSLQSFPRLPFEPITKARYEELELERHHRVYSADSYTHHFEQALGYHDMAQLPYNGAAGCDSDKCMMPEKTNGRL